MPPPSTGAASRPEARPSQGKPQRPSGGVWRIALARLTRPRLSPEALIVLVASYWAVVAHGPFFSAVLRDRSPLEPATWGLGAAVALAVVALQALLLALIGARPWLKPLLALLAVVTASTSYFMQTFGVVLDPDMVRNVLRTNTAEASELLTLGFAWHLLWQAGPLWWLLWRVELTPRRWVRSALIRASFVLVSVATLVAAVGSVYGPLASLMRNQREIRYLITPANALWSTSVAVARDIRGAAKPKEAIGLDAAPGPSWAARSRPLVVVVVVGESARDADWGLSVPSIATTPKLSRLPVVSVPGVTTCGTDTETSLPCMFAPIGRRDYDASRIRGQESLLHVLARAGVAVHWRDNQSGCKGVCDGLPGDRTDTAPVGALCPQGRCFDEALIHDLDRRLASATGTQLWALHMIGSHGPSYYRRYPAEFEQWRPACRQDDLQRCSVEEIRNAYRNTLVYTDHVLARAIQALQAESARVDSVLVYISDHGESLGERGLFLHGFPYAIAPSEQTRVPMVLWASTGYERSVGLPEGCLRTVGERAASQPVAHDHLFHTLLSLTDVRTALHEDSWDLTTACRTGAASNRG